MASGGWSRVRWILRRGVLVYLVLLVASHLVMLRIDAMRAASAMRVPTVEIPTMTRSGPLVGRTTTVAYRQWTPDAPRDAPPVILLHGSPGAASNLQGIGALLADAGYRAIAIDLPGFGRSDRWVPGYSLRAHARSAIAVMDELGVERAHLFGFSMGGGVAIWVNEFAPERVATMTLLSSVGVQVAEGSGDYYFEHAKYAVGYGLLVVAPEFIPHFGLLGPRSLRHAFIRNFWDTDQRPIADLLPTIETPTLIIHGRHDFLVPAWGAELHHRRIATSRLVILDTGHYRDFLFNEPDLSLRHALPFLERHSQPGVPPLRGVADFAPDPKSSALYEEIGPFHIKHTTPFWIVIIAIILGTFISEDATVITVGILIARGQMDFGVGLVGCFLGISLGDGGLWAIGRFAGRRALDWPFIRNWVSESSLERWSHWFNRHAVKAVFVARAVPGLRLPTYLAAGLLARYATRFLFWAVVAALLWTPLLLVLAGLLGQTLLTVLEGTISGPVAIVAAVIVILTTLRVVESACTWTGRRRLLRDLSALGRPEFWPTWALYLPAAPYLLWLSLKHRGPLVFTCMNPGIPHGGGVVGESKMQILSGLECDPQWIAHARCVDAAESPDERAAEIDRLVREDERLGGYPVILKPDEAQRGHGLKLARSKEDVERYCAEMTRRVVVQAFHPGPHEVGVLWARRPTPNGPSEGGRIFSITRKVFPAVIGDGASTLERLIWTHPRYRMQAETFLRRYDDAADRVIPNGERFSLAIAGNHSQGTMFRDGADLITPELEARIDEIALSFRGEPGPDGAPGTLDYGRFDLRYTSDEALRRAEDFVIIELNGTMSESTNMYDPGKPVWWTYAVLFRQWRRMYALGAARRRLGGRPIGVRKLLRTVRRHYRGRPGSSVSD